jgi:hypothetical protein
MTGGARTGDAGDEGDGRGPAAVEVGGRWTYHWAHRRKPHLHPVATPSGYVLTQVEPADHPWQRGVWFVVKFVDGDNFWEEGDPAGWGVQHHTAPPAVAADGLTVEGDLDWIRPDRATVAVTEHRRLTHVPLGDGAYAIDWDVTLRAPAGAVLDRTPYNGTWGGYSGLAFRGRADWEDTRLLLDDGQERDRVAPERSRWCDLASAAGGVCVLDHPANPSHPVPFYATCRAGLGYGEGWSNTLYPAFLWDGPQRLAPGEPLRFRYRVAVHDGQWDTATAERAWGAFAATPG